MRNLGPLVTLVMEVALHKPDNLSCNARTTGATLAIAAGVWMYEANDMMWSERGFFFLLANLGFACAERMLQVTLALALALALDLAELNTSPNPNPNPSPSPNAATPPARRERS